MVDAAIGRTARVAPMIVGSVPSSVAMVDATWKRPAEPALPTAVPVLTFVATDSVGRQRVASPALMTAGSVPDVVTEAVSLTRAVLPAQKIVRPATISVVT